MDFLALWHRNALPQGVLELGVSRLVAFSRN